LVCGDICPPHLASHAHRQIHNHLICDVRGRHRTAKMLGEIMPTALDSGYNTIN
jgi:hypothetical protein